MLADDSGFVDWPLLRQQGMAFIQAMNTGTLQWTDYNTHDPGITLLETLCYAITDLSNRVALPIEDLLWAAPIMPIDAGGKRPEIKQTFFTAQQALPNAPLTLDDYRRWLIDQPRVNNAWLLYNNHSASYFVYLYLDDAISNDLTLKNKENEILKDLARVANIGERFASVTALPQVAVTVELAVTLKDSANQQQAQKRLIEKLQHFFSMALHTYSFGQMCSFGQDVENILTGPLPQNGFVEKSELDNTAAAAFSCDSQPVFSFNLTQLQTDIEQLEGVNSVESCKLKFNDVNATIIEMVKQKHCECIGKVPFFKNATINLTQNNFSQQALPLSINDLTNTVKQASNIQINFPQGRYQNLAGYASLQNDLPEYYGLGQAGLPANTSDLRKHQVDQLRNYLTLFDQTLCDYFAQLDNVSGMLAMRQKPPLSSPPGPPPRYFMQPLPKNALAEDSTFYASLTTKLTALNPELQQENFKKKNDLLDHLLALFAETYIPQNIYLEIKKPNGNEIEASDYLQDKQTFLNQIVLLRGNRSQRQGLTKIIALKLGILVREVIIKDLVAEQPLPIPCNQIAMNSTNPPVTQFKVANSPTEWLSKITVLLPDQYKQQTKNGLYNYATTVLNAEIPAHIVYSILKD